MSYARAGPITCSSTAFSAKEQGACIASEGARGGTVTSVDAASGWFLTTRGRVYVRLCNLIWCCAHHPMCPYGI